MESKDEFIKGFALTGEIADGLKNKQFVITDVPRDVEMKDFKDKEKTITRLCLDIKLADGVELEWFPNKTAQGSILAKCGFRKADWKGFKGKFIVKDVQVGKDFKKAVFIE